MQFLGLASVVTILGVAGVSAASTLRNREPAESTSEGAVSIPDKGPAARVAPEKAPPAATEPVVQQAAPASGVDSGAVASNPPAAPGTAPVSAAPVPAATPAPSSTTAPLPHGGFVLVEGRSRLSDSVYAIRSGDSVVVNFDAYGYRTRRASRLENSLRETLPLVFGRTATAFIDTVETGGLVTNADVIGSLATEGMRVTLGNGVAARLRVLTRVVSDGPIAIGYIAIIER